MPSWLHSRRQLCKNWKVYSGRQRFNSKRNFSKNRIYKKKGNPCETDLCKNFNGWYEASDLGDGIKGKKIDVYGGLEIGRDSYFGKGLPEQANAYIGKLPQGTKLEDVLRNRSPRISKNNPNYQPKKVPIRRDARGH